MTRVEFNKGRYLGLFSREDNKKEIGPFQSSSLSLVPKSGNPGKFCLIQNISHSHTSSINQCRPLAPEPVSTPVILLDSFLPPYSPALGHLGIFFITMSSPVHLCRVVGRHSFSLSRPFAHRSHRSKPSRLDFDQPHDGPLQLACAHSYIVGPAK